MVKMQHSVQRGCQGYCLSLSGGFSASRLVRWLLGFSACPAAPVASRLLFCPAAPRLRGFSASWLARRLLGFAASRLVRWLRGFSFSASRLLGLSGGFSASRLLGLCRTSRLRGFSASRLVSGFSASRLLGFWSHFWAPFARALWNPQRQAPNRASLKAWSRPAYLQGLWMDFTSCSRPEGTIRRCHFLALSCTQAPLKLPKGIT